MGIEAIIFDCDGTILDNELVIEKATLKVLAEHGIIICQDDLLPFVGFPGREVFSHFLKRDGKSADPEVHVEECIQKRRAVIKARNSEAMRPVPGVVEFIQGLNGYRMAVAGGYGQQYLEEALRALGIYEKFDVIIAGEQAPRKPAPDIYLLTAKCLGVKPENCLVIENSPTGIQSAKSAGMYCIAITAGLPQNYSHEKLRNAGVDGIVATFAELGKRLMRDQMNDL